MSKNNFTYGVAAFIETIGNSSRICDSAEFFKSYEKRENHDIAKLRSDLYEGKSAAKYTCLYCGGEVRFRGGVDGFGQIRRRLHAFHIQKGIDCPYTDKKMPTSEIIKAKQFHGLQNGEKHESIKRTIKNRLENVYSANVKEETRVYSIKYCYRQADLLATFADKKLAVEVQISTLDLSVVNQRNKHYRDLGIYILWILDEFSPKLNLQSFTQQRILVTNEYNVFAFDEVAKRATENNPNNELCLHCYYSLFDHNGEELNKMDDEVIPFSSLHFRDKDHMVYYKSREDLIREAIVRQEQKQAEEKKREQEYIRRMQEEENRQLNNAIEHIRWVAQRKTNNTTGKEYNLRDLDDKYHILTTPRNYIKKAFVEFIAEFVDKELQNTSPNESEYDYTAFENLLQHSIKYNWIDLDLLADKEIMPALKAFIDRNSLYIIESQRQYDKEDFRRKRLELICYIYSLLKLQHCKVGIEDLQSFTKGWRFISKLYSLFIGQIIGSKFPNFAALTNEVTRQYSHSYPYGHLYLQAYQHCISSQRNYIYKHDKATQYRINELNRIISSTGWQPNHDLDMILQNLFSLQWKLD